MSLKPVILSRGACWVGGIMLLITFLPGLAAGQDTGADASPLRGKILDPVFSPSDRSLVAYTRQVEDIRELYLHDATDGSIRRITASRQEEDEEEGVAGGFFESDTERELSQVEGQLAWRPVLTPGGRQWFVFVSSAGEGGYGLYLSYLTENGSLATDDMVRLPFKGQAGFPTWSPDGRQLVFSGSRQGQQGNELYLYPDIQPLLQDGSEAVSSLRNAVPLTDNPGGNLHPEWAPDGQSIAYQSRRESEKGRSNWGISLIDLSSWPGPRSEARPRSVRLSQGSLGQGQTFGNYHEYKPSWSPDGRYVAFYISQGQVGAAGETRRQDLGVLEPVQGPGGAVQTGRSLRGFTGSRLAENVLPNENRGPEWHPSSASPSLIYVAKEEDRDNPIYLANIERWRRDNSDFSQPLTNQFGETTKFHEEVEATLASNGLRLAFASQVGEALQFQVRDGLDPTFEETNSLRVSQEVSRGSALWRSAVFPGWGQLRKGQGTRALLFAGAGAAALGLTIASISRHQRSVSDYDDFFGDTDFSPKALAKLPGDKVDQRFAKLQSLNDDVESAATVRTAAIVALVGVWAWNLYDTYRGFPSYVERPVYANESLRVEAPTVGMVPADDGVAAQFSLRVRF